MNQYVAVPIDERLLAWRKKDHEASEAEAAVRNMGQAAADPAARELLFKAKRLRAEADREFAAILRAVRMEVPNSERDSSNGQGSDARQH